MQPAQSVCFGLHTSTAEIQCLDGQSATSPRPTLELDKTVEDLKAHQASQAGNQNSLDRIILVFVTEPG